MQMKVAPFAGAWIEMYLCGILRLRSESLPSRERGLKSDDMAGIIRSNAVAPFAGAWIEILIVNAIITASLSRSLRGSVD